MSAENTNAAVAEILAAEMRASQAANEASQADLRARGEQASSVTSELLARMLPGRGQHSPVALHPDVQAILAALQGQPRLIPAVKRFLEEKVAAINAAVDQILGPTPPSA